MTFADFRRKVSSICFPIGEAENLIDIHTQFIIEALAEIQKYVKCYQTRNADIIAFNDTRYNCGLTVTGTPLGPITRVYTIGPSFCCKVFYRKSSLARLRSKEVFVSLDIGDTPVPTQFPGNAELPLGDLYPDISANSTIGRAATGLWAIEGCRLYVWPHIQSNEDLVVEWTGVKTDYTDSDPVFDDLAIKAVRAKLLRDVARNIEGNDDDAMRYEAVYREELAELFHWCRMKTEGTYAEEDDLPLVVNGCVNTENINNPTGKDDTTPTTSDVTTFAIFGEYGSEDPGALAVAQMVNSWAPSYVLTTGGNNFFATQSFNSYDRAVGRKYHQLIYPYSGSYGGGSADYNRFWPTIGADDYADAIRLDAYFQFFTLPSQNGERYYDRIEGPIHFFVLDSNSTTPDGNSETSIQAEWLRLKLSASTSPFKIVLLNHAPYSSVAETTAVQWPFQTWGATIVINGKNQVYERVARNNLLYLTNGLGGRALGTFGTVTPGSLLRYNSNYGALKGTVNCNQLTLEFISIDGAVVDTIKISHE